MMSTSTTKKDEETRFSVEIPLKLTTPFRFKVTTRSGFKLTTPFRSKLTTPYF